ncbi:D-tyrosyl-tRNA deacylase, partial [Pseudomonas cichorii]
MLRCVGADSFATRLFANESAPTNTPTYKSAVWKTSMKGLLQRVQSARVEVAGEVVGAVDQGLLVLVGVEPQDTQASADKLLHKLLNYRVFSDEQGKMNLSLQDVGGGLLLVSQFTLAAVVVNFF